MIVNSDSVMEFREKLPRYSRISEVHAQLHLQCLDPRVVLSDMIQGEE